MNLNDKKNGFTLIELLAVIVILAIVTVIGATTVLPYIKNSAKDAFAVEANHAIDSASQAMSLYHIGAIDSSKIHSKNITDGVEYCFTLKELVDLGLWTKDAKSVGENGDYKGIVKVIKNNNSEAYTYSVEMSNKDYGVTKSGSNVTSDDVKDKNDVTITNSCS